MNVLIVENNRITSTLLAHTLDKYGYETHSVKDGERALNA